MTLNLCDCFQYSQPVTQPYTSQRTAQCWLGLQKYFIHCCLLRLLHLQFQRDLPDAQPAVNSVNYYSVNNTWYSNHFICLIFFVQLWLVHCELALCVIHKQLMSTYFFLINAFCFYMNKTDYHHHPNCESLSCCYNSSLACSILLLMKNAFNMHFLHVAPVLNATRQPPVAHGHLADC